MVGAKVPSRTTARREARAALSRRRHKGGAGKLLSPAEFERAAQKALGGNVGRLPLSKPRPSGVTDVEIELITDDVLTQVKRVTDPDARFGRKMQEQFEMTVDAAQLSGRSKIRYVVTDEAPDAFVEGITSMPLPEGISLTIERLASRR